MKEMNIATQRARDLVAAYDHSLEQQIVGRGLNLVCRDEKLWKEVEELLRDEDALETHCLGLDPLRLMEESLKAAATTADSAGRVKATGGLRGLAKAFEVLEQASLNLYLGPWRQEYKIVKMYSGMFTHYIKPVLSMSQIEKLFGLLGYQPGSSGHEQLRLQSSRVGSSAQDNLRLSCAFFLARCECRLLLAALGKHVGKIQWELSVVRERQRGNNLQVSLDNTKKTLEVKKMLEVNKPLAEPFEAEVDLYTDEQVNGGQRGPVVHDDESSRSLTSAAVKAHSNGMTSLSSSFTTRSTREHACTPTFNCQPTATSLLESASRRQGRRPCGELTKADTQSHSLQTEAMRVCLNKADCSCLQSPHGVELCVDCNTLLNITCALHKHRCTESHRVVFPDNPREEMKDSRAVSPQSGSLRASMSASPTLTRSGSTKSSSALIDGDPKSIIPSLHAITYHDCCDLTQLDPQVVCFSCGVFHSGSCRDIDFCQRHHEINGLGVCSCGRTCSRNPIVLCRYCGSEYCTECWYRSPVECTCGQTFDLSSSV